MEHINKPGLVNLLLGRPVQERMVLTVEPGIYFINHLLDQALPDPTQSCFINSQVLARCCGFGGFESVCKVLFGCKVYFQIGFKRQMIEMNQVLLQD